MDPVHSFGYQHLIDGFTLGELFFIHTFSGARSHITYSLQRYLRLHISCHTGAYPIFFGLRRVPSGVVPLGLIVFIDSIVSLDLFDIASV